MALRLLMKYILATAIFVCFSFTQLNAQDTGEMSVQEAYPLIFKDFQHHDMKQDIIRFFEKNFAVLIADIEKTTTRKELPALGKFLKAEFLQYADMLQMKNLDLEQRNKWIAYKQKEYQSMILGRKIQNIDKKSAVAENVQLYTSQLRSLLSQLLEVKLAKEQSDIDELGKRLENLKRIHQSRKKNKKKILQNRFDELVGDKQLYQW